MERKISICIPTYQRTDLLFKSFEQVYDDDRVDEIVIVDDASDMEIFEQIRQRSFNLPKIKLHRNVQNRDCYENKYTALSFASNDWCILLDSDNMIGKDYLDKIFEIENWEPDTVYAPVFAYPSFDYRSYSGMIISKQNVSKFINKPLFSTALNTANYFVYKINYLKVWSPDINPVTTDSIFMSLQFFKNDMNIFFVPGLQYFHRVHSGSHYQNNISKTPTGLLDKILKELRELK